MFRIEEIAGSCPNYGYNCMNEPVHQAECFLDLLEFLDDPCMIFVEQPICVAGQITEYGFASCNLQECFELTTYESCMAANEVWCSF